MALWCHQWRCNASSGGDAESGKDLKGLRNGGKAHEGAGDEAGEVSGFRKVSKSNIL